MHLSKDTWLILEVREEDISMPYESGQFLNPLLKRKIEAAERLVPADRLLLMMTDRSCAYVGSECIDIPSQNILIHPSEWGNAAPMAVWLLEIRRWNPRGRIVFVPTGNTCRPTPELRFAFKVAFHSLERDPTKVFLIQFPLQQAWKSLVVAPAFVLLALYLSSTPHLIEPLLEHFQAEHSKDAARENLIVCPGSPSGDLYEEILSVNPIFLKKLPVMSRVIPGPIHGAAALEEGKSGLSPTFH